MNSLPYVIFHVFMNDKVSTLKPLFHLIYLIAYVFIKLYA